MALLHIFQLKIVQKSGDLAGLLHIFHVKNVQQAIFAAQFSAEKCVLYPSIQLLLLPVVAADCKLHVEAAPRPLDKTLYTLKQGGHQGGLQGRFCRNGPVG